jgi:solute carrier family 66 (lysosomal lysine-arginine transporter), member 1
LAIYYTLADLVLLAQCFYYEGFTLKDKVTKPTNGSENGPTENTSLLQPVVSNAASVTDYDRRGSFSSFRERLLSVDATHLSPATPLLRDEVPRSRPPPPPQSLTHGVLFNLVVILMVCAAGVLGWWLGNRNQTHEKPAKPEPIEFNTLGQVFGYICAALYLGSRIPQLLLNFRRKSTEGVSMLFFLFACIGNLTYALSIMAYEPVCEKPKHCRPGEAVGLYGRAFLVNLSWLIGSLGSLLLDLCVFVQYFMYKKEDESESEEEQDADVEPSVVARRERQRRDVAFEGP